MYGYKDEEKRKRYLIEYNKVNKMHYGLNLMKSTDKDIIEVLEKQDSKQGFIKEALRHYIQFQENKQK